MKCLWSVWIVLLLLIEACCLSEYILRSQTVVVDEYGEALLALMWMLTLCLAVWGGLLFILTCRRDDLLLVGLLATAILIYPIGYLANWPAPEVAMLLFGVTLGKGARFVLNAEARGQRGEGRNNLEIRNTECGMRKFLMGLVLLLAFASWWHFDMSNNFYHGPRWMGLWNNPNDYGLLMGAGVALAIGLIATSLKSTVHSPQSEKPDSSPRPSSGLRPPSPTPASEGTFLRPLRFFVAKKTSILLLIAAFMMGVGLVFSYSRGAWVGAVVGLLYLAKACGKFKWRWVLTPVLVVLMVICFFWNNTPDNAPWYIKRLDLSRGSVQHRVAAWKAGFEIMRDHPFGVGWNKAVETYQKNYSPPEGGAAAITTNDYLMLGTQLGIPGLVCFVAYVGLCFRSPRSKGQSPQLSVHSPQSVDKSQIGYRKSEIDLDSGLWTLDSRLRIACRSAAIAMLVAFWFDGGLFKLATASVFWILLELGAETRLKPRMDTDEHGFGAVKEHGELKGGTTKDTNYTKAILALRCLRSFIWSSVLAIRVHLCPSVVKAL